jgi:hypothetical protein
MVTWISCLWIRGEGEHHGAGMVTEEAVYICG